MDLFSDRLESDNKATVIGTVEMDPLWIILIAVLLLAVAAGCIIVHRYDGFQTREKALQIKEAEKASKGGYGLIKPTGGADPDRTQPDIPVWRDEPTGIKE